MTEPRYGATPEEWAHWDLVCGLADDLLPVVCRPGAAIASYSNLTTYGKVPSQYDRHGHVIGIPAWTSHHTSDLELARWMAHPDYGICLQTRTVHALDFDLTDPMFVLDVLTTLSETGVVFPVRTRPDSSKCLVLFSVAGNETPLTKQILQTPYGAIEFLATGQQCLVAGTHPNGARYQWRDLDAGIPTLTVDQFRTLHADLAAWFGEGEWTVGRPTLPRGQQPVICAADLDDPVFAYLHERQAHQIVSTSPDGRLHVVCPWAPSHTAGTDPTATTYFPAGTGGYEQGHFHCLHAHCAERTTSEFLKAIGFLADGFSVVTDAEILEGLSDDDRAVLTGFGLDPHDPTRGTVAPAGGSPLDLPRFERDLKTGKIKWTLPNLVAAFGTPRMIHGSLAWDTFRDQMILHDQTDGRSRPFEDQDYPELALRLYHAGFQTAQFPMQLIRSAVLRTAMQAPFDSAIQWLTGLPAWDGLPRVSTFCTVYLGAEPSAYSEAVSRYWWTAHAGRIMQPGIQADMAIVLVSAQGTGKTSLLSSLVPHVDQYVELSFTDRDEDLSRSMRGRLIGEIAELRGLSSRDHEAIKAWVSRRREVWVPKYMEMPRAFPRRLVLVGTSNQDEFLADETGNRRWLPINVGEQDRESLIRDREQLWAEALVLFQQGGIHWYEAQQLAQAEHEAFEITDPWEETIQHYLTTPALNGERPIYQPYLIAEHILRDALNYDPQKITMREKHRVGKILRALGFQKSMRTLGMRRTKVWSPIMNPSLPSFSSLFLRGETVDLL